MTTYILRRILISVPLLLVMSFITFGAINLPEGDPLASYRHDPMFPRAEIERLERQYRLDKGFHIQYFHWMTNLFFEWRSAEDEDLTGVRAVLHIVPKRVRLNLGYSFDHKRPVVDVIGGRLLNTLLLSAVSLLLVWAVAIPVGTYSAVNQYSLGDKVLSFLSFIGMSFPNFFLALLLLYLASLTGVLPTGGLTSTDYHDLSAAGKFFDIAKHMAIPIMVIVTSALAGMQRLMRGNMLEVLRMQYITTARAKGLPERKVIYRHALRNAVNPMITIFGYQFSGLLSGVALTEMITSYPGLGSMMLAAVISRDIYMIMASMLMSGVMLILGNLLADILLSVADPRISYE